MGLFHIPPIKQPRPLRAQLSCGFKQSEIVALTSLQHFDLRAHQALSNSVNKYELADVIVGFFLLLLIFSDKTYTAQLLLAQVDTIYSGLSKLRAAR